MRYWQTHSDTEVSMGHSTARKRYRQIALLRTQFAQADRLAFADVLSAGRVEAALHAAGATWRAFTMSPFLAPHGTVKSWLRSDLGLSPGKARIALAPTSPIWYYPH